VPSIWLPDNANTERQVRGILGADRVAAEPHAVTGLILMRGAPPETIDVGARDVRLVLPPAGHRSRAVVPPARAASWTRISLHAASPSRVMFKNRLFFPS
jgi:hypothetical protein